MFVLIGPDVRQDLREQRRTLALYIRAIIYLKREFDVLKYFSDLGFQYFNTKRPGEKEKKKKKRLKDRKRLEVGWGGGSTVQRLRDESSWDSR